MTTGLITEFQGRVIGITKHEVKIITPDVTLPPEVVWFTNVTCDQSLGTHYIGDKPFGGALSDIKNYRLMINALDKQFVKPFSVTNDTSLFSFVKKKIGVEARTLSIPPEHIKSKMLTGVKCGLPAGGTQRIETPCTLNSYRIPSVFGNFKVSTHRAGTKIGIYFCTLLKPKGLAGTILPPGDYWLTHIQIASLSNYYDIAIKESYTFHQAKQKDVSLKDHKSFSAIFGRGYQSHKIAQCLVEEYLFSMPGIKQGTLNPISVMLRSQRWLKSFKTALAMAESGLKVYRVEYNHIVVED